MAVFYVDSAQWTAVTAWAATTAIAAGALRRQLATPAVNSEAVFVCIVAGTTGSSEPVAASWTAPTAGQKTASDGTVTWQECTGRPGTNGDLTNCPNWTAVKNTTPGLGQVIQNNAGTFFFILSTNGLTGNGSEPSWTLTAGVTTVDNAATWTCIGAVGNFSANKAPFARVIGAYSSQALAGQTYFVGDDHAETGPNSVTISPADTIGNVSRFICVDHTKAPPGSGDLKTTASITTTTAHALQVKGGGYWYGFTFKSGAAAGNGVTFQMGATNVPVIFDTCAIQKLDTAASTAAIEINSYQSNATAMDWVNTTVQFGNVGDSISVEYGAKLRWRDTASAIAGSTIPTTLFGKFASPGGEVECEGVDLSALGSGTLYGTAITGVRITLINCKLGASYTLGQPVAPGGRIRLLNCDSGGTNYISASAEYTGTHTTDATVVRSSGASAGTPFSWKILTTAQATWLGYFPCMCIPIWNDLISVNRVVTLAGIWNSSALPNNDDIWLHCEYLGSSGSPLSSFATQTKSNTLATGAALPADSLSAWDTNVTARQNSHSYSLGNIIKVPDNAGRIFFCTTAGTSASSEPAGYATAVDGGSVTDSGATFRAAVRFSLTVTLSSPQPAQAGDIACYIRVGKASSPSIYVDPNPVLG